MTIAMCATWIVLFVLTSVAFWKGKIFISSPEETLRDDLWSPHAMEDKEEMGEEAEQMERGHGSEERTIIETPYCADARSASEQPMMRQKYAHSAAITLNPEIN